MKFWDFDKEPYRPVENHGWYHPPDNPSVPIPCMLEPVVFVDALGRMWHAGTETLRAQLPAVPTDFEKIPSEFWHPDSARKSSFTQHKAAKQRQEDRRIDGDRS